jgi:hypothetical protein
MSESPVEHFEHAEHAALLGDPFLTRVAVTIAILAVIAATVGSLETLETAAAIGDKNAAVHQRHALERTALLWAAKRRGAKGFVGSGQMSRSPDNKRCLIIIRAPKSLPAGSAPPGVAPDTRRALCEQIPPARIWAGGGQ